MHSVPAPSDGSGRRPAPKFAAARLGRGLALPLAILLTVGAAVLPPAVPSAMPLLAGIAPQVALAADGLRVDSSARYVVEPDRSLIRVTVDLEVSNTTPNKVSGGVITRYFYDGVNVAVQPEATGIAATQGGSRLTVRSRPRDGYRLVEIDFRSSLFYQQSTSVRLTFLLPAGEPRSSSDVRVGKAFATFLAWAFGDAGSVRIEIPAGFTVDVSGEDVARSTSNGRTILTASTADPLRWYAWVNARNDDGLTRERLDIAGDEEIIVRGWPEDAAWRRQVADLLTRGVPELVDDIGLPWPVAGPLSVLEIHTPLLEGYAGFYDVGNDQITISEDLDNLTIIHEASHAWFNRDLFVERWITEGLADEYASRVLVALGDAREDPGVVRRSDAAAFPLNDWPPPAAIQDEESAAREQYGYDASWTVMRQVVAAVGLDGMRKVFRAAQDRTTAYAGAGAPESAALPNDWRRFLDLTEELGGGTGITALVQEWALPGDTSIAAQLRARTSARDAYHDLLAASGAWSAPYAVRRPLDAWQFSDAEARIAQATAIISQRDATEALAGDQGLTPPDAVETAYEAATEEQDLAAAATLAADTQVALESVAAAAEAAARPRDWLVALGLDGKDPDGDLVAARTAWSAGDLQAAAARATAVITDIDAAPGVGRDRATVIGVGVGAVLLVVIVLAVLLVRRRSRRGRSPAAVSVAVMGEADVVPVAGPPAADAEGWLAPPPADAEGWLASPPVHGEPPAGPSGNDAPAAADDDTIVADAGRTSAPAAPAADADRYATLPPSAIPDPEPKPGPADQEGAGPT